MIGDSSSTVTAIGLGPANLAVGLAILEGLGRKPRAAELKIFERSHSFRWHQEMLVDGASMQVSFLKDLALFRDPSSKFTFLNYLHSKGRLESFANLRTFTPSRKEYADYLRWCSLALTDYTVYGSKVESIELDATSTGCTGFLVRHSQGPNGPVFVNRAKNVLVGAGSCPHVPKNVVLSSKVFHSDSFLSHVDGWNRESGHCITVVGAGQSAAECVLHLYHRHPHARIRLLVAGYALKPADSSEFVNELFSSAGVDDFERKPVALRQTIVRRHRDTNYGVVDPQLISALYEVRYLDSVGGIDRLKIENHCRFTGVVETPRGLKIMADDESLTAGVEFESDYLVFATGYRPKSVDDLFAPCLREALMRDESGAVVVTSDHKVALKFESRCLLMTQGRTEEKAGLGATLLSNLATRSGIISKRLIDRLRVEESSAWTPNEGIA